MKDQAPDLSRTNGRGSLLAGLRQRVRGLQHRPFSSPDLVQGEDAEPIRAELFSVERLEQHAESLAIAQTVSDRPEKRRRLSPRVRENGRVLLHAYRAIAEAIREEHSITPAAEWLIDNFHIVEEQVREIQEDLPPGYYRELPKLDSGHLEGYPRIFGLAWAFVAHTDSRFDPEALLRFVRAYQRVVPLTIGELWAVAITLRVLLVENLRRLAEKVVKGREARQRADALADRLLKLGVLGAGSEDPGDALEDLTRGPLERAFAVQLLQRLREQDPHVTPALRRLDEVLALQDTTPDDMVRAEHLTQVAMNVTVRNIITSMRAISAFDWKEFFEVVSLVDETLRAGSAFETMDFPTRDRYRHAIEDLSRGSGASEIEVAALAVRMANGRPAAPDLSDPRDPGHSSAGSSPPPHPPRDPGHLLISRGRRSIEKALGFRPSLRRRFLRSFVATGLAGYATMILLLTGWIVAVPLIHAIGVGVGWQVLLLWAPLGLLVASAAATPLVNRFIAGLLIPWNLPKLEHADGAAEPLRTIVVVPTLLTTHADVDRQVERLEVHYLSNPEGDLRFALLTDWTDALEASCPGDEELAEAAASGIAALNERYGRLEGGDDRFFLYHRKRVYSESERRWMGWERKRGKLHELNRMLRGARDTTFVPVGNRPVTVPRGIKYVITLDAETRLPRGAATKLVATIAHPLNQPRFDPASGRVAEGYAIVQPRITASLPSPGEDSVYRRVSAGPAGIDPYASAVSEVYQDLFGEGSYAGKGIYDIDAFEASHAGRVPANALLSHDLFEGIFARCAFAADIELIEDVPSSVEVAAARQHRWTRGDWLLLPWILGLASDASGRLRRARLPALGRWKMLDNLRRTLVPPAAFLGLLSAWALAPRASLLWTQFIIACLAVPWLLSFFEGLLPRRRGISKRSHIVNVARDGITAATQVGLSLILLPQQAWIMADAITRSLFRLFVSGRRRLEWVTEAQTRTRYDLKVSGLYRRMAGALLLTLVAGVVAAVSHLEAGPAALGLVVVWAASPWVVRWISLPHQEARAAPLSKDDVRTLRLTARRAWRFFEVFVGDEDNHLPPDNFQQEPRGVVAHRTSPTNIGLYLLSAVSACDFGWLGALDMIERLEATLATMKRLARSRGHFYNWYDTRDLRPLEPRYISSVDSGNLAGHLVALAQACRGISALPLSAARALEGTYDNIVLLRESMAALGDQGRVQIVTPRQVREAVEGFHARLADARSAPSDAAESIEDLILRSETLLDMVQALSKEGEPAAGEALVWARALHACLSSHRRDLRAVLGAAPTVEEPGREGAPCLPFSTRLLDIALIAEEMAAAMDFTFLFDPRLRLFSIGFREEEGAFDPSYYDLLASEARLTSFLAIAKGDVPTEHWFRLGRPLTPVEKGSVLVSWSGSMFEYLMPAIVMHSPPGSLLNETCRLVVQRQIHYGAEQGVPWGISESAFSARDLSFVYQYSNFGVPGLGLKRGLAENLVVSPYATALAAMFDPAAAASNFRALAREGALGDYGYYEALDYTASRLPEGERVAVVRAFMAHHQGMSIVSIDNALNQRVMQARFHASPMVRAAELLLQERTPRDLAVSRPRVEEIGSDLHVRDLVPPALRRFTSPHDPIPRTHVLSNGRYVVMLTAAGSGYSRCGNLAVTRWREDPTCDDWGSYIYLRDPASGDVWSATHQPSGVESDSYEVAFSEDRVNLRRRDGSIATAVDVVVSSEDDAEVRRVSLTNLGGRARRIELTSYAEIVLALPADDEGHTAFSRLFVQTEYVPALGALLATRRPRSPEERPVWAAHIAAVEGESGPLQFETDRSRFLGRGRTVRAPISVVNGHPLSNTAGPVLDPIFSLRVRVRLEPGATARVTFSTMIASSRESALDLVDKYRDPTVFDRTMTLAWTQAQVQLHHLGIAPDEAHLFQRLANRVIFSDPSLRAPVEILGRNAAGASALWAHGISGDLPIVLLRIDDVEQRDLARQIMRAHEYFRMKGLSVDVVILIEKPTTYDNDLESSLQALLRTGRAAVRHEGHEPHGNVFILRADILTPRERDVLHSAARAVLVGRNGTLAQQTARAMRTAPARRVERTDVRAAAPGAGMLDRPPKLEFFNGLGGFGNDGREYVIVLGEGQGTPAPWINVISNPAFGFQVSESGSGYTWALNSRENKLTPWSNDAVVDPPGEAIYLCDEETGEVWTPTAQPIREAIGTYIARHGQGYSRFERVSHGLSHELLLFAPEADPVKIFRLRIENRSSRPRHLSVTGYVEWVLGVSRSASVPFIVTEIDERTGAMFARNSWNAEFGSRVAFLDLGGKQESWTGDRTEFLGRNGSLERPAALAPGRALSKRTGAGLDACGALQASFEMGSGRVVEFVLVLGQAATVEEARALVVKYRETDVEAALAKATDRWNGVLRTVEIRTPDRSMDLLVNRWLLYQCLGCRVWARTAFYQASGAYGFRDQLQDVMAIATARPDIAREHILRAAGHQFPEGDVQHWWHQPSGRGVRTRISDDLLWLVYAVCHYVRVTGDLQILDEVVPFVEGPLVGPGAHDVYFQPATSEQRADLFEHCVRAIRRSLPTGTHGLPLIGAGDWNDGMNRIGPEGRGESVWLGWFLHTVLMEFAPLAEARDHQSLAEEWTRHAALLREALEREAWDGDWYRRAFTDDGVPIGTAAGLECRIDSIAQSWAVISRAADPRRAARAMAAVEEYLIRRGDSLVLLLTPPFEGAGPHPGYIQGYLPGVRENGGQYTHAAIWTVVAFAMLGDGDKAAELFALLNPINGSSTRAAVHRYKVEPYVVAADVYSVPPHVGRGGWTWYTGAAGWMHRAAVEWILGVRKRGDRLFIDPCIPRAWPRYEVVFRHGTTTYRIAVENPQGLSRGVTAVEVDGQAVRLELPLADEAGARAGSEPGAGTEPAAAAEPGRSRAAAGGGPDAGVWSGWVERGSDAPGTRPGGIPLVDDGGTHEVRVVMGALVPSKSPTQV